MIRHIVAIDSRGGFAKFTVDGTLTIPWNLPGDKTYYHDHIRGQRLLMGRISYDAKRAERAVYNYVLTHDTALQVVNGEVVSSVDEALAKNGGQDLWVIGGETVYAATIHLADELYITRVDGDFLCDRFYPKIPDTFARTYVSEPQHEHGATYRFEVYKKQR